MMMEYPPIILNNPLKIQISYPFLTMSNRIQRRKLMSYNPLYTDRSNNVLYVPSKTGDSVEWIDHINAMT